MSLQSLVLRVAQPSWQPAATGAMSNGGGPGDPVAANDGTRLLPVTELMSGAGTTHRPTRSVRLQLGGSAPKTARKLPSGLRQQSTAAVRVSYSRGPVAC